MAPQKGNLMTFREDVRVLDCTIRDGGLCNDFRFTDDFVRDLYQTNLATGTDYMEFGYKASVDLFNPEDFGKWKFCSDEDIYDIVGDNDTNMKISVMADVGRTDYKRDIRERSNSPVDLVRVATYVKTIPAAIDMIEHCAKMGYETTCNVMAVTQARREDLLEALELLGTERYDLVLLDLNLPGKDGMTVLRTLRQADRETKVLILSARGEVEDKVEGLDAGANDYLAKPFHLAELEARIRSLTLRQFTQRDVILTCGALSFDTRSRTAAVNGQTLTLTRKETGILEYLMVHQGRPVSQEELMDHVWDNSVDNFSNSIRVHISALRKKLRAALGCDPIRNRIGEGYLMGGEDA